MSNNKGEQAVLNRRLRPIYDAIDSGQNKKAIQEADKVLKKNPKTFAAKALKALAMIRLEKSSEAYSIIYELEKEVKNGYLDENFIQALVHCYKDSFEPARIVSIYEEITRQTPNDEQNLAHLFMAYVRLRNFKMQQKVAMQLYKEFQHKNYYVWAIMSVFMQGYSDEKLASTMFYPLAEKMFGKINKLDEDEFELYLLILEARNKIQLAIDIVSKDFNEANGISGTLRKNRLNRLLALNGQHFEVVEHLAESIKLGDYDWASFKLLFDSAFKLIEKSETKEDKNLVVDRLADLVNGAMRISQNNPILKRAPLLASLELYQRMKTLGLFTHGIKSSLLIDTPLKYIEVLLKENYAKPFCFVDLDLYFELLSDSEIPQLLEFLDTLKPETEENLSFLEVLKERIALKKDLKMSNCEENFLKRAEKLAKIAQICSKLPTTPELSTVAGRYAQILAHNFCQLDTDDKNLGMAKRKPNCTNIQGLITTCEFLYRSYSKGESTIPLLLCRAYGWLGAPQKVEDLCEEMSVRYVQRESLAYLQFFLPEKFGHFKNAILFYTSMSLYYDQCEREVSECLVNAYKNGQFSQIPKLTSFEGQFEKSVFLIGADVMNRFLSSCFVVENSQVLVDSLCGDQEAIKWEKLVDNRDFDVINSLRDLCSKSELAELKKQSFDETLTLIHLYDLMCRAVGAIGKASNTKIQQFFAHIQEFMDFLSAAATKWCHNKALLPNSCNQLEYYLHVDLPNLLESGLVNLPIFAIKVAKRVIHNHCQNFTSSNDFDMEQIPVKNDKIPNNEQILEFANKLPQVDELEIIIKSFLPDFEVPMEEKVDMKCAKLVELIEKSAKLLQFITITLMALKLSEGLIFQLGWIKAPLNTLNKKEQKDFLRNPIFERFCEYENKIWHFLTELKKCLDFHKDYLTGLIGSAEQLHQIYSFNWDFLPKKNQDEILPINALVCEQLRLGHVDSLEAILNTIKRTNEIWIYLRDF